MKFFLLTAVLTLFVLLAQAQRRVEGFNISFNPTAHGAYYYVVTEKQDTLWHRQAYYLSLGTMAMEGWYKDERCRIQHGLFTWYHPNRSQKSTGRYVDGKKESPWLQFDEEGNLTDSINYKDGWFVGVSMKWHKNGYLSDSMQFDGAGNGVQVSWYNDGTPSSAGRWINDTMKNGRWKYFHRNGKVMATEDYVIGKKTACACYDSTGMALDSSLCKEVEASVDKNAWRRFLETGLQKFLEMKANAGLKAGEYTVVVRFLVDQQGNVTDVKPLTNYGGGMEEEVVRLFKNAPRWTPGQQFGRKVKSYHTQPVTFVIQEK